MKLADPSLLKDKCLVDGKWVGEGTDPIAQSRRPATLIAKVPRFGDAETIRAIEAAQRAFGPWAKALPKERARILRRWFDLIIANRDDIALIMTSEQGKPLAEALGEVDYAAGFVEFFAEEAKRIYGEVNPTFRADSRIVVLKQPIGVVAAITPWNFPAAMITRKVAPALAVGCTVVAKPAPETPLTALALGELALRAGMPPGVLNLVTGDAPRDRQGDVRPSRGALDRLHRLDRGRQAADAPGGGHGEEGRARTWRQCAVHRLRRRPCRRGGRGRDRLEIPQHGPDLRLRQPHLCAGRDLRRFRRQAHDRCREAQGRRRDGGRRDAGPAHQRGGGEEGRGACRGRAERRARRSTTGGKRHKLGRTFYEPTVLSGVDSSMLVAREETFGPIAPVFRFKDEADVDRPGQRHPIRPRLLFLRPRPRPGVAGGGGARIRHGRASTPARFRASLRRSAG